ncbi:hypothetical protein NC01_07380 [Streptococcus uberis]|nr:hypothetical protein NC01_07380 [Streptococcus uberis]
MLSDGTPLYYQLIGQGKPLLMIHGNGGSHHYFKGQLADFSEHFQLILVDCRARGLSGNASHHLTFPQMVADFKELLDFLEIDQVAILGFSDGANIALQFACTHPQRVTELVLNAPNTVFTGTRLSNQFHSVLKFIPAYLKKHRSEKAYQKYLITKLLFANLKLDLEDFQVLTMPTLVIVGQNDMIKLKHSQMLAKTIPNCQLIEVPGMRHTFAKNFPQVFNTLVFPFLLSRS